MTRLTGGLHFLFVQGTDLAGNTGSPMRYDWIVGKYVLLTGRPSIIIRVENYISLSDSYINM